MLFCRSSSFFRSIAVNRLVSLWVITLCCSFAFGAQLNVQRKTTGKHYSVQSVLKNGLELVSVSEFAEALGFTWKWDRYTQSLSCVVADRRISLIQDNCFYTINGVVGQLAVAPVRLGGQLYVSLTDALELFETADGALEWNAASRTVKMISSNYSITSVSCEKKQNGTLLTINLGDSLLFDITYFYPNLTINFLKGTIDTQSIKDNKGCGVIKSISSVQFKGSAQVSILLKQKIEEPVYDYVQDTKTLMLSLRAEKQEIKPAVFKPSSTLQVATLKTIVIDPGHGGKDPGAIGVGGVQEKKVTLAIALKLKEMLKQVEGITVYLTREKDVFIPLQERTKFANDKKADLFISIHADAVPGSLKRKAVTRGYKVYFLSQAKNEEDKLVAMRENAVIELEERPQNYSSLQNVLIDLAGNEYLRESQDLCILIDQKFNSGLKNKIPKLHLGVGQANFWVLNGAFMPSVLIEAGFLSNPQEEALLASSSFQKEIASAIYEAIVKFKKNYEGGL